MTTTPEQVHRIEYVALELPPVAADDDIRAEYRDLPQPWQIALGFLIGDIDNATCENDCGTAIGYHCTSDGTPEWRITYLARLDDRGIVRLCEDCSPSCPSHIGTTGWLPESERIS